MLRRVFNNNSTRSTLGTLVASAAVATVSHSQQSRFISGDWAKQHKKEALRMKEQYGENFYETRDDDRIDKPRGEELHRTSTTPMKGDKGSTRPTNPNVNDRIVDDTPSIDDKARTIEKDFVKEDILKKTSDGMDGKIKDDFAKRDSSVKDASDRFD